MQRLQLPEREIIKYYKNGDGTTILGRRYKCHPDTINGLLRRNDIKIRPVNEANYISFWNGNRKSGLIKFNKQNGRIGYFPTKIDN